MYNFIESLTNYKRRLSDEIIIGGIRMGKTNPVRIQSMTNTDTLNTKKSVEQCIKIINAGGELVRLTTQGIREVENLINIKSELEKKGYKTPIIADVHFNPKVADVAAEIVEKVRINPGNYSEKDTLEKKFKDFLSICNKNNTAIRIGVNHGSLSERILDKFGNTPKGMVESAMEFLRICKKEKFTNVVVSMKASNTRVMVYAYRLLLVAMQNENMQFPLHLGVTEAGDGEDGRIKSVVGIGTLLNDGIGDTIRVSLTESPEAEIPVAKKLVEYVKLKAYHKPLPEVSQFFNPYEYQQIKTKVVHNIGGKNHPIVIGNAHAFNNKTQADYYFTNDIKAIPKSIRSEQIVCKYSDWNALTEKNNYIPLISDIDYISEKNIECIKFIETNLDSFSKQLINKLKKEKNAVLVINSTHINSVGEIRVIISQLLENDCRIPVILKKEYKEYNFEIFQIKSTADLSPMFIDGIGNGLWLINNTFQDQLISTSFNILQATRSRFSKTEYIACPSCGRTLFNIQKTLAKVREKTSHLKSLKIAVMGCIVNGPGEMADADYGYVGAGKGKVCLYKKNNLIKKDISEKEAIEELISIIKQNGDWELN